MTNCIIPHIYASLGLLLLPMAVQSQECKQVKLASNQIKVSQVNVANRDNFMTVSMKLNLDSLKMPTNSQLIYTPMVTAKDSSLLKLPEIVINGRRQQVMFERGVDKKRYSDKALVVKRTNGKAQTIDYQAVVPVESKKFRNYDLSMHEDLCGCGNVEEGDNIPLQKQRQPNASALYLCPEVEAVKIRHLDKRAYIDFPVDKITLYPEYRRNPAQLDSIISTINALKNDKNLEVSRINIHGYASPESPYGHNDYLAKNRAKTLTEYVRRMVKLPSEVFTVSSTPEDWEGLREYIKDSNLEHQSEILAIASDETLDPDVREAKIKKQYPDEYRFMLSTWYPALRHSDYHITYKVKPFDVAEAKEILKTKPQQLSLNEMFMVAQTYAAGSKEFNEVMETAVRLFPNDPVANLNAAITRLNAGDADGAKPYLDKAGDSENAQAARKVYEELKK